MPVIRISDATFVDLRSVATWLGTNTPGATIEHLVREHMEKLGLERDIASNSARADDTQNIIEFEKAPGLTFTRILSSSVQGELLEKPNWANLLLRMIRSLKAKLRSPESVVAELQISAKVGRYELDGYTFQFDLGLSVQGQSASDAWKEISRLAEKHEIPVEVKFQWRDNEKAQHPGRIGIIRAGS